MVNSFRDRIRQPIEKLMQSARRLLEIQSDGEQKQLVESLLENALLLQTNVGEGGTSNAGAAGDHSGIQRDSGAPRSLAPAEASSDLQP
jgi:hypothetical protein